MLTDKHLREIERLEKVIIDLGKLHEAAEARASALEAERDKLEDGIVLAANRLDACAVASLPNSHEYFRLAAWRDEARALLTPAASGAEQGGEDV